LLLRQVYAVIRALSADGHNYPEICREFFILSLLVNPWSDDVRPAIQFWNALIAVLADNQEQLSEQVIHETILKTEGLDDSISWCLPPEQAMSERVAALDLILLSVAMFHFPDVQANGGKLTDFGHYSLPADLTLQNIFGLLKSLGRIHFTKDLVPLYEFFDSLHMLFRDQSDLLYLTFSTLNCKDLIDIGMLMFGVPKFVKVESLIHNRSGFFEALLDGEDLAPPVIDCHKVLQKMQSSTCEWLVRIKKLSHELKLLLAQRLEGGRIIHFAHLLGKSLGNDQALDKEINRTLDGILGTLTKQHEWESRDAERIKPIGDSLGFTLLTCDDTQTGVFGYGLQLYAFLDGYEARTGQTAAERNFDHLSAAKSFLGDVERSLVGRLRSAQADQLLSIFRKFGEALLPVKHSAQSLLHSFRNVDLPDEASGVSYISKLFELRRDLHWLPDAVKTSLTPVLGPAIDSFHPKYKTNLPAEFFRKFRACLASFFARQDVDQDLELLQSPLVPSDFVRYIQPLLAHPDIDRQMFSLVYDILGVDHSQSVNSTLATRLGSDLDEMLSFLAEHRRKREHFYRLRIPQKSSFAELKNGDTHLAGVNKRLGVKFESAAFREFTDLSFKLAARLTNQDLDGGMGNIWSNPAYSILQKGSDDAFAFCQALFLFHDELETMSCCGRYYQSSAFILLHLSKQAISEAYEICDVKRPLVDLFRTIQANFPRDSAYDQLNSFVRRTCEYHNSLLLFFEAANRVVLPIKTVYRDDLYSNCSFFNTLTPTIAQVVVPPEKRFLGLQLAGAITYLKNGDMTCLVNQALSDERPEAVSPLLVKMNRYFQFPDGEDCLGFKTETVAASLVDRKSSPLLPWIETADVIDDPDNSIALPVLLLIFADRSVVDSFCERPKRRLRALGSPDDEFNIWSALDDRIAGKKEEDMRPMMPTVRCREVIKRIVHDARSDASRLRRKA
jgi:hypothetical protein